MVSEDSKTAPPQRIILRFRTSESPTYEEVTTAFFKTLGLPKDKCYFHWQPRDYEHTHVIVDVCGEPENISDVQSLPHSVYRVKKRLGDQDM